MDLASVFFFWLLKLMETYETNGRQQGEKGDWSLHIWNCPFWLLTLKSNSLSILQSSPLT